MNRKPSRWEKILTYYRTEKGLISKVFKELQKLNNNIANHPVKKWERDMSRHSLKEEIQLSNRHETVVLIYVKIPKSSKIIKENT